MSDPVLSADDIIRILQAAQETAVVRMKIGAIEFERDGYIAPAPAPDPNQELQAEIRAAQDWSNQAPPANVLGEV